MNNQNKALKAISLSLSLSNVFRNKVYQALKQSFVIIFTAAFLMSGFFVAVSPALAAHTTTATVDQIKVKGASVKTYSFTINKTGGDDIVYVKIENSNFTSLTSLTCPAGWTSSISTYALCTWPFEGDKITGSAIISFTATAPTPGTDTTYNWTVTTKDASGGTIVNTNPQTTVDVTAPTISTITTKDANGDGKTDTATIVFSEPVLDSSFAAGNFSISGVAGTSILTGTADDNTFDVVIAGGIEGTEAKDVTYTQGTGADMVGNLLVNVVTETIAEIDGAAPIFLFAKTYSTNTIDLTFSEALSGATVANSDFSVTGYTLDGAHEATQVAPGVVRLTTTATFGTGDTPHVSYTGEVKDLPGLNAAPNRTDVTPADGVAPVIASTRTLTTTTIQITFSEAMSVVDKTDFAVAGNTIDSVIFTAGATTATLVLQTPIGTGDTPQVSTIASPANTKDNATVPNIITGSQHSTPVDGIAPTVVLTSAVGSYFSTATFSVTAIFNESVTGFVGNIGDITVTNGTAGNFVPVSGSVYTFDITSTGQGAVTVNIPSAAAQDLAVIANNSEQSNTISTIFDNVVPATPAVLTPNGGNYLKGGASYNITWTPTSDTNLGGTPIKIEYSALGTFADTITLADNEANDGTYAWTVPSSNLNTAKIRITATDWAGNHSESVSATAFTIDSTNPTIQATTLLTPSASGINLRGGQPYNITWTAGDITDTNIGANPITIQYASDGSTYVDVATGLANSGTYTWTVPSSNLSTAKIRITATDLAGNSANDTSDNAFLIDSIAPTIDAGSFANPIKVATAPTGASATDGGSGIATYAWTPSSVPGGGTLLFSDATSLASTLAGSGADGSYTALLTVTDHAGNVSTDTVTFIWDTTNPAAPAITLLDPINNANKAAVTIIGTGEANAVIAYTITTSGGGGSVTGAGTVVGDGSINVTGINVSTLADGTLTASVTLTDAAGNTGAAGTDTATKDATLPIITSITSNATEAGWLKVGNTITFTLTPGATEAGANVTGSYNDISLSWSTADGGAHYTATYTVAEGNTDRTSALQISGVVITDAVGNPSSAGSGSDVAKTIDAHTPATPTSLAVTGGVINNANLSTVHITGSAETGSTVTVTAVGGATVANSGIVTGGAFDITIDATTLADGSVNITARTADAAGNVSAVSSTLTVTKDTVVPSLTSVTLLDPINNANKTAATLHIVGESGTTYNYSIDDATPGSPVTGTGTLTGGDFTVSGIDVSSLDDGTLTASVTLIDAAGNQNTTGSDTATKDTLAPTAPTIGAFTATGETVVATYINNTNTGFTLKFTSPAANYVGIAHLYSDDAPLGTDVTFAVVAGATEYTLTGNSTSITQLGVDGVKSLTVKIIDAAGNVSVASAASSITKDLVVPIITSVALGTDEWVNISEATAGINIVVATTGVEDGQLMTCTIKDAGNAHTVSPTAVAVSGNTVTIATTALTTLNNGVITARCNVSDQAGNAAVQGIDTATKDEIAPNVASIILADSALKVGETSLVTITFSEAVTGFDNTDITTIDNGTLTTVSSADSGITWTATFTPTDIITDDTNIITVTKTGVTDLAGNAGVGTTSSGDYAIDTVRPTVEVTMGAATFKVGETTTVTFTFSETPTEFTTDVVVGNGAIGTIDATNPLVQTATYTPTNNIEVNTNVIIVGTAWTDTAGNAPLTGDDSPNYTIDTKKPSVILASATADPTNGLIAVTAEFSENVIGFEAGDITVGNGAVENFLAVDGNSYTFNVNPTDGANVVVTIQVPADKATDAAGNNNTVSNQLTRTSDTVAPTVAADKSPSENAVGIDPNANITVTFSEAVNIATGNVTLAKGANPAVSTDVTVSGNTATINPASTLDNNSTYTVILTGITDLAGNALPPQAPWSFTTAGSYSITLVNGWNLISLPVVPTSKDIVNVLGTAAASIESVWTYDAGAGQWYVYRPSNPGVSNLVTMNAGYGYWINYTGSNSSTLNGAGNLLLAGDNLPPDRTLYAGWNLIGYYQRENTISALIANALANDLLGRWSILAKYNSQSQPQTFSYLTNGDNLNPGEGFWIFLTGVGGTQYNYTIGSI
ncbi:Ig-like domain-containing protein [Patescibacteria group bacterium]|nr:Ig-like domain-containing protein [Patescibacteria group bacterium]